MSKNNRTVSRLPMATSFCGYEPVQGAVLPVFGSGVPYSDAYVLICFDISLLCHPSATHVANADGTRTALVASWQNGSDTAYTYQYDANGNIIQIAQGSTIVTYSYDAANQLIRENNGLTNQTVTYEYDSWGKLLSTTGSLAFTLGTDQPFRYRGYVYDTETSLYYLQTRYYDPATCRFISSDVVLSTGQGVLGHNAYAYCGNNPVDRIDSEGEFWSEIWEFVRTAVSEIENAIWILSPAYAGCGGVAFIDGPLPFGDLIGFAGAVLLTVGAVEYGINQAAQAPAISISKAEGEVEAIPASPPTSTAIYGYGGTNPGNLTPKAKDKYSGLSFSTVPMPSAAVTTIEALNATGVVYAIQDGPTHVSVRPIGATVEDCINAGSGSIWAQAVKSVVSKGGY